MPISHTPGPWTQATLSQTDVVADGGTMVAMARDGLNGIARDQAVANARLIAAAPDLLAALRVAKMALAEAMQPHLVPGLRNEYDIVAAAIAQATGA